MSNPLFFCILHIINIIQGVLEKHVVIYLFIYLLINGHCPISQKKKFGNNHISYLHSNTSLIS